LRHSPSHTAWDRKLEQQLEPKLEQPLEPKLEKQLEPKRLTYKRPQQLDQQLDLELDLELVTYSLSHGVAVYSIVRIIAWYADYG
jgi:hypothetical protein